jgi:GNAT superfamily N-acetyltransferase
MEEVNFYHNEPLDSEIIKETFRASFGRALDLDYWNWRFLANPHAEKIYISYILADNKLAAYYAVSPNTLWYQGNKYKVALSNMTMTHPEFQGKGLFRKIAMALYNQLKEDGYSAVYGFANSNSHYGFRKNLGWIDLAGLTSFQLAKEKFRYFTNEKEHSGNFEIKPVTKESMAKVCEIMGPYAPEHTLMLGRDYSTLVWRFLDNPENEYFQMDIKGAGQLQMTLFFKKFQTGIDIMEVFIHPLVKEDYYNLLTKGIMYLFEQAEEIYIWSNLHFPEHIQLEKMGFRDESFNTYFGIIPLTNDSFLTHFPEWYFRFMDSDVY